jgi:hypothetical protein
MKTVDDISPRAKYERWPFLAELERIFDVFNTTLFNGSLTQPVQVVQPDKKVVFRYSSESHSLIIGSKFASANLETILQDYLHEMIHMENYRLGDIDCTSNQYHNKKFLDLALEKGFYVFKHPSQGWSKTKFKKTKTAIDRKSPNADDHAALIACLKGLSVDKSLLKEGKDEIGRVVTSSAPAKICFLKYVCSCPQPHNSIRSGRRPDGPNPLNIMCLTCGKNFSCQEGSESLKE